MLLALLSHPVLLIVSALIGLITWHFILRMYWVRRKLPPGPFPIPFVGNFLYFKGSKFSFPETVTKMSKIYGDPTTIWLGSRASIFLNTYQDIREALIDNIHDFQDRPETMMGDLINKDSQDIIFAPYNNMWRFHKKVATRAMRRIVESSHLEYYSNTAIDEIVDSLKHAKTPVVLRDYTTTIIANIINSFCFGERIALDDPFFLARTEKMDQFNRDSNIFNIIETIPGVRYFTKILTKLVPKVKQLDETFNFQRDYVDAEIDKHRRVFDPKSAASDAKDILEALMYEQYATAATDPKTAELFNDEHLALIILDIFLAGVETTSVTLQWFILRMIMMPDLQESCYEQIKSVCGDRTPQLQDRSNLPLIEATIMETLRYHPIAPMGVPTSATHDTKLGDYSIPKGTLLITNLTALHFDEELWENPEAFEPKRFIADDGLVTKNINWLPFGVGKRVCLGESLAKNELFLVVTGLLQRLKFKHNPNEKYTLERVTGNDFNWIPSKPYTAIIETR